MQPYAIFMDIDGTLVDRTQIPTAETVAAIAKYQQAGHQFFIASGRPLFSASVMAKRIGDNLNIICSNGSVTKIGPTVQNIHLTSQALSGIYAIAKRYDVRTHFFTKTGVIFLDDPDANVSWDARNRIAGEDAKYNHVVHSADALLQFETQITNGFAFCADDARRDAAKSAMAALADVDVSSSNHDNIEITARGINKAFAIKQVCQTMHIPLTHTIAFGDGDNDLQMLETVAHGVAMGNANPTVAAAVCEHTLDVHHNGVAHYLQDFFH